MSTSGRDDGLDLLSAELSVIGGLLTYPESSGAQLARLTPEDFRDPALRALYGAAADVFQRGGSPDPVQVAAAAGDGYRERIVEALRAAPTARNLAAHVDLLRDAARLRRLREAGLRLSMAPNGDEAEAAIAEINAEAVSRERLQVLDMRALYSDFSTRLQAPKPDYLHFGIPMLDSAVRVGGGAFLLLGGRPSAGKTALALRLGMAMAGRRKVGFYSLETSAAVIADRLFAAETGVGLRAIQQRELPDNPAQAFRAAFDARDTWSKRFEVVPAAGLTVADVEATALNRRHEVVIIDYVQLLRPRSDRMDRAEQVAQISRDLRAFAMVRGIAVLGLVQLRRPERQQSGGAGAAPTMDDIKESGQLEQDADAILLLYLEQSKDRESPRILKIAKNKEGPAGIFCRLQFDGLRQTFTPISAESREGEMTLQQIHAAGRAAKARRAPLREATEEEQMTIPEGWKDERKDD